MLAPTATNPRNGERNLRRHRHVREEEKTVHVHIADRERERVQAPYRLKCLSNQSIFHFFRYFGAINTDYGLKIIRLIPVVVYVFDCRRQE